MEVKDRIFSWFIRNIVIPRMEIIDKPGFIICKVTGERGETHLRELFLPEQLCSIFENEIVKKDEKQGHAMLYTIGKKFGYIYCGLSDFPNLKTYTMKEIVDFIYYFIRYMEATYAGKLSYKIDSEKRIYKMFMDNYVVCRYNGIGYLLSDGGSAGTWSYMMCDPTIEAIQPKCQGRGDKECEVIAAPYETLVKMGYKPIKCTELETLELDKDYLEINKIRPTNYAKNSLRSLIDSGFFKYEHGQVTYEGERFFLCEASFMYILERELKKIKNGLKILWDVSFDFGEKLANISGKQEPCKFITDFVSALGFGDILAVSENKKYKIYVRYFPWNKWYEETDFTLFRGMISGILSGFTGKKVVLSKIERDLAGGYFSISISE